MTRFPSLDGSQALRLEAPFTEVKILKSPKEVDSNKAPEPDDFPLKFAQSFWDNFRGDLLDLFQGFYESREFDHRFSESFIFLIMKVKGPSSLNDFRPISLLGWIHKLVARILTSRFYTVIDQLISHTQMAFIRAKSIYDVWVIAFEVLDVMKMENAEIIFKLDFEKTYDQVSWQFLGFILHKLGFGDR